MSGLRRRVLMATLAMFIPSPPKGVQLRPGGPSQPEAIRTKFEGPGFEVLPLPIGAAERPERVGATDVRVSTEKSKTCGWRIRAILASEPRNGASRPEVFSAFLLARPR